MSQKGAYAKISLFYGSANMAMAVCSNLALDIVCAAYDKLERPHT